MPLSRRDTLRILGAGFGTVGLADGLMSASGSAPHFAPRAKRVIFLYLNGGLSHVDTFDPKPALAKFDGQPMPGPKIKTDRASGGLMKSPFEFRPYGESGLEVSDIFPRVGSCIDDILVVRSMWSESVNHLPSMLMMNTGHALRGGSRPSFGSWVVYGLGTDNREPSRDSSCCAPERRWARRGTGLPRFSPRNFRAPCCATTRRRPTRSSGTSPMQRTRMTSSVRQLDLLDRIDSSFVQRIGFDPRLESDIEAMETAFRMQAEAPGIFDLEQGARSMCASAMVTGNSAAGV